MAPPAPAYVPGRKGQALDLAALPKTGLTYSTQGNLNLSAGTIAFWIAYPEGFAKLPSGPIFQTGRPDKMNCIQLYLYWSAREGQVWFWGQMYATRMNPVRFDICDWSYAAEKAWKPGEWHHVMIVWNDLRGITKFFDGKAVGGPPTNNGPFAFQDAAETMTIGPSGVMLDDFRIYDRPMTPVALAKLSGLPPADKLPASMELTYDYVKQ